MSYGDVVICLSLRTDFRYVHLKVVSKLIKTHRSLVLCTFIQTFPLFGEGYQIALYFIGFFVNLLPTFPFF